MIDGVLKLAPRPTAFLKCYPTAREAGESFFPILPLRPPINESSGNLRHENIFLPAHRLIALAGRGGRLRIDRLRGGHTCRICPQRPRNIRIGRPYGGSREKQSLFQSRANLIAANVQGASTVAWSFDTHEEGGLQSSPIIIDGVLYGITPTQKNIRSGCGDWANSCGSSTPEFAAHNPIAVLAYWGPMARTSASLVGVMNFVYGPGRRHWQTDSLLWKRRPHRPPRKISGRGARQRSIRRSHQPRPLFTKTW